MKRIHVLPAVLVAGACLAAPASAGIALPAFPENEFEGLAERDPYTYVGFDVAKKRDEKKVAKVTAHLAYACDSGETGRALDRVNGKLSIDEDGEFAGTLRGTTDPTTMRSTLRGGNPRNVKYRLKGKLKSKKKAKGTIDAQLRFTPGPPVSVRGEAEPVRCYTGALDWKAKRGAEVEPPPSTP